MLKDSKKSVIRGIISFAVLGGILFSATTISGITTNAVQDKQISQEDKYVVHIDKYTQDEIEKTSETNEVFITIDNNNSKIQKWQGKIKDAPEEVVECLNDEFEKEHAEDEYKFVWITD